FFPVYSQWELGGDLYGIPWLVITEFTLWWNKQAFETIGVASDRAPDTLVDLRDIHDKYTQVNPDGTLNRVGFQPWDTGNLANSAMYWAGFFGSQYFDSSAHQWKLNDEGGVEALAWQVAFTESVPYRVLRSLGP